MFLTFSLAWIKVSRTNEVLSCEAIDDTASGLFFGKVVGMYAHICHIKLEKQEIKLGFEFCNLYNLIILLPLSSLSLSVTQTRKYTGLLTS